MPYRIYLSDDSTYVIIEQSGKVTRKLQLEYNIEAHKVGKEHHIKKYLMDVIHARNTESNIENYQFTYEDLRGANEIDKTAIVALVVDPEDHSHDFIETLSINSGLNVTLFRDKTKAIEFLKKK
jgi:heme oxygenase